jgi:NarL family two-component system response regulator LiaR
VAHNFVEAAGVPESFSALAWSQAEAQVRGETSQDAWETRRRAQDSRVSGSSNTDGSTGHKVIDERSRNSYYESAFSDALAVYMLSLAVDFDYHDLREREYPLLAAPALAERLRHVAGLFPANSGYEFQILYRRKGYPIMKRHVLIFGLVGGLLIATLQYTEYRFVIIEHSVELYSALVAILFAAFGIWLGLRITRSRDTIHETIRETVVVKEVPVPAEAPAPFTPSTARQQALGITARELEILTLVARGLSNREIATQLFVSENTVKTHCARAFDKLGAARRTQAVQRGKELGLLP